MKNIFKSILVAIVMIGGFTSCSESDLSIDTLYNEVDTTGAALRVLEYPDDIINVTGGGFDNCLCFLVEVQEGDGSFTPNFTEVRVFISTFDDQDTEIPTTDEEGNEFGEILYQTVSNASFDELSPVNGLPMYQISIPTVDMVAAFSGADFNTPSFIVTRFELEMTDGRVWSVNNAGSTLSGPYFESPFTYKTIFLNN
tara:strand:+ start:8356 stop:8949 length:594 start_codon:yes stop_codon:yes gene_type:complete